MKSETIPRLIYQSKSQFFVWQPYYLI